MKIENFPPRTQWHPLDCRCRRCTARMPHDRAIEDGNRVALLFLIGIVIGLPIAALFKALGW